jgi:dihydroorotate dehydrogenase electron transfer subunit
MPAQQLVSPPQKRSRFDATVEVNRAICREHYVLRMRIDPSTPFPPTRPGQFIQLGCRPPNGAIDRDDLLGRDLEWQPGQGPELHQLELCAPLAMLRRPFSMSGRGDDQHGTWIEIIHRVVGVGTHWLAELQPGDAVDFIGPLGNAFELPRNKSIGMLVGGGVGLPPMFYLAEAMHGADWKAVGFVGALCRDLLAVTFPEGCTTPSSNGEPVLCASEFSRFGYPTVITTDDGSFGLPGRITAGLEGVLAKQSRDEADRTVVYTCGPEPMMHAVAKLAAKHGVDCQVCLEQAMACGMSTCQSCVVKIDPRRFGAKPHATTADGRPWRFKLACTDGPVFDARDVVW